MQGPTVLSYGNRLGGVQRGLVGVQGWGVGLRSLEEGEGDHDAPRVGPGTGSGGEAPSERAPSGRDGTRQGHTRFWGTAGGGIPGTQCTVILSILCHHPPRMMPARDTEGWCVYVGVCGSRSEGGVWFPAPPHHQGSQVYDGAHICRVAFSQKRK